MFGDVLGQAADITKRLELLEISSKESVVLLKSIDESLKKIVALEELMQREIDNERNNRVP